MSSPTSFFITEPRQFRDPAGYVGFRRLRTYQLHFARLDDGTVLLALNHRPEKGHLVVPQARFEEWWVAGREP